MNVIVDTTDKVELSLMPKTKAEAITQQLYIIIQTIRGEVPMYRDFGTDYNYKDMPLAVARSMYVGAISEAIQKYMPEATLTNVDFGLNSDYGEMLMCSIEVTVNE